MSLSEANPAEIRQILGPVRQVGYIVRDVEACAADWAERLGIGPWRIKHGVTFDSCTYQGRSIDVEVTIASSYSAGMEIELIGQAAGPASMYSDFLETRGPGAQHICFFPNDYTAAHAHLLDTGLSVVLEGVIRGTRFAYLDDGEGIIVEIADLSEEGLAARADRADAAEVWSG